MQGLLPILLALALFMPVAVHSGPVYGCPDLPAPMGGSAIYFPAELHLPFYNSRNNIRMVNYPWYLHHENEVETLHTVGSTVQFECESRYYELSGSRTRRCQETGTWSGRPAICLPVCGRSDSNRSPFIFNGNSTDVGQWPWQAGIAQEGRVGEWSIFCGASLLNELWVITAGHCVTYTYTNITVEPDEFRVYLGKHHRDNSKDDEYVQVRKIREIHVHPYFDYGRNILDADIALIQLDSPVKLTYRVQPICLPTKQTTRENLVEGKKGVVAGWGANENFTLDEMLRQAVLPVVSQSNCRRAYEEAGHPVTITEHMFCAGYEEGRIDSCLQDSGGPFMFVDESSKAVKWVLEGIVSWGVGCTRPKTYGGYTTVSKVLDWIHWYI